MPRLARAVVATYFAVSLAGHLLLQAESSRPGPELLAMEAVNVVVCAAQYAFVTVGARRLGRRAVPWVLAGQVLLAYPPLVVFGRQWGAVVSGFLAGWVLLLVRPPLSVALVAVAAAAESAVRALQGAQPQLVSYVAAATLNSAVLLFGLVRFSDLVKDLHATRLEFAAASAERERIEAAHRLGTALGDSLARMESGTRRALRALAGDRAADPGSRPAGAEDGRSAAVDEVRDVVRLARETLAAIRVVASEYRAPPEAARSPSWRGVTPRTAWTVPATLTVTLGLQQLMLLRFRVHLPLSTVAAAAVLVAVVTALQLRHATVVVHARGPAGWPWTLALQTVLAVVPYALLGYPWNLSLSPLAGAMVLLVRSRWAWAAFVVLVFGYFRTDPGSSPALDFFYNCSTGLEFGLLIYAVGRLTELARRLDGLRERLAALAVLRERDHISRDVHDLQGFGLFTVAVQAELALHLVPHDPEEARAELRKVLRSVGHALAEVRSVARRQVLPLGEEAERARATLAAAGARVRVELPGVPLPPGCGEVLAAVLREGVTNVLRHAAPRSCAIEAGVRAGAGDAPAHVWLSLRNDGVPAADAERTGYGLENLTGRAEAAGGRLTAGRDGDGGFRLLVRLPLDPAAPRTTGRPAAGGEAVASSA